MEITWGLPTTTRTVKEERFTTPVVSLVAITASKAARKFTFNKAAKEALGLTDYCNVMLGFAEGKVVIKNLGNLEEGEEAPYGAFTVTKSLTFSDKKIFEHIIKLNKLDITKEHHIHLIPVEGQPFMIQSNIDTDLVSTFADVQEVVEETADDVFKSDEEMKTPAQAKIKASKEIVEPVVKAEPAPERVKFAIDNTEDEPVVEEKASSENDEEEEW
jgi:hypothetical protein